MLKKDGGRAHFNTYSEPIFDDKRQFKGYRGVCRHISDSGDGVAANKE